MDFPLVSGFVKPLSDCDWLDAGRARAYARVLLAVTFAGVVGWIALSPGGLDRQGKPIGTDFVGFYTASHFALAGHAELAYDVGAHWAAQRVLFGPKLGYTAFFYPPPALMIYLPLALAPYFVSLAVWLAASGLAFYRVLRGYLPSLDAVMFLAFPAVFANAAHGQNGFLCAALLGGGLLIMDRRPRLAGLCFGAMAFKPHLALAIPFALIFARRWTTSCVASGISRGWAANRCGCGSSWRRGGSIEASTASSTGTASASRRPPSASTPRSMARSSPGRRTRSRTSS